MELYLLSAKVLLLPGAPEVPLLEPLLELPLEL
jgi:hypothetical protein